MIKKVIELIQTEKYSSENINACIKLINEQVKIELFTLVGLFLRIFSLSDC
jgi:hypothetical protein